MVRHKPVVALVAMGAMFLLPLSAGGGAPYWPGPTVPPEGVLGIATGGNSGADGYLSIVPDDYGSWATGLFGGGGDIFNPLGALGPMEATFTSGLFVFLPGAGQRELLSDSFDWQAILPFDGSLERMVTSPLVASDTNGNSVNDTLHSSFRVFGPDTDLAFNLLQHVEVFDSGVSFLQQDYLITNNGADSVALDLVRVYDGDFSWAGDFADDEVGTNFNGSGLDAFVFEREAGDSATAMTLSSPQGQDYYGGKHGITPPLGPPMFDYGTDTEVWDAFGIPTSWQNYIAGVGYNTNGTSGAFPSGSTPPEDAFIGLKMSVALEPGESSMVTMFYTYGSIVPAPEPATLGLLVLGVFCLRRRKP